MDASIFHSTNVEFQMKRITMKRSDYGYEGSLKIPRTARLGVWKIQVDNHGRKISKSFEVQEYDQDKPELLVETSPTVAFVDRKVYLNIHSKNAINQYFNIHFEAKFVNSSHIEINKQLIGGYLTDSEMTVAFDFKDDLDIEFPANDMTLTFTVHVKNQVKGKGTSVSKEVYMRHKGRNTIQVARKKFFKPDFKFPIKVRVKFLDGKPDNSLNQLSMTVKYGSKDQVNGTIIIEEKNFQTHLENGEMLFTLHPKADTLQIQILVEFDGTKHQEIINRFPGPKEYLQISMLNKRLVIN